MSIYFIRRPSFQYAFNSIEVYSLKSQVIHHTANGIGVYQLSIPENRRRYTYKLFYFLFMFSNLCYKLIFIGKER